MEDDYSKQFIQEVHNNLQTTEVSKKQSSKKLIFIVLGLMVAVGVLVVGIVALIKNLTQGQQLEQFKEDEATLVQETEKIFSDPAFSVLPYYDDGGNYYIDVWGADGVIIVKIVPLCASEYYEEYTQAAREWLDGHLSDLSKYNIEVAECGAN